MTWDDVMRAGLGLLLDDPDQARSINSDLQQVAGSDARRRLVQATLPMEIDQRLLELQLDLNERPEPAMTLEQLWAIAVLCWLRSTA